MLNRNQVIQNSELSTSQDKKLNKKNRVDINILLNRVRADNFIFKKRKTGNFSNNIFSFFKRFSNRSNSIPLIKINYKRYLF